MWTLLNNPRFKSDDVYEKHRAKHLDSTDSTTRKIPFGYDSMCQYYLAKLQVYIDSYTSCNAHARMKSTHKKELRTYRLLLNNTPDWLQKRVIASNVNGKDFFISVFERSLS